jgi:hypothetical protein
MVKQILHDVDEEIKLLERSISSLTIEMDDYYETLKDCSVTVIDNKITQEKLSKARSCRDRDVNKLNEAIKIKHMIEKYKD